MPKPDSDAEKELYEFKLGFGSEGDSVVVYIPGFTSTPSETRLPSDNECILNNRVLKYSLKNLKILLGFVYKILSLILPPIIQKIHSTYVREIQC